MTAVPVEPVGAPRRAGLMVDAIPIETAAVPGPTGALVDAVAVEPVLVGAVVRQAIAVDSVLVVALTAVAGGGTIGLGAGSSGGGLILPVPFPVKPVGMPNAPCFVVDTVTVEPEFVPWLAGSVVIAVRVKPARVKLRLVIPVRVSVCSGVDVDACGIKAVLVVTVPVWRCVHVGPIALEPELVHPVTVVAVPVDT